MIHTSFSKEDVHQIITRGQIPETVLSQIEIFKRGVPYTKLHRPCTVDDGITVLQQSDMEVLEALYAQAVSAGRVTKFVPASGAATRMFQALISYCELQAAVESKPEKDVLHFINNAQRFAFYDDLEAAVQRHGGEVETYLASRQYSELLAYLLTPKGLNYANLPKILLKFHCYSDHCRTPLEEHLVEAAAYAQDRHQVARLHVTVTPAHAEAVQAHIEASRKRYERAGLRYEIALSVQSPATDTVAVDLDNNPVRDAHGHLLFRPGGHGALLANLQALAADIVFIKNIDNVVPDHHKEVTYRYKRALGGHLVHMQQQMFAYLGHLAAGRVDPGLLEEILTFARQELAIVPPSGLQHAPQTNKSAFCMIGSTDLCVSVAWCGMRESQGEDLSG